MNRDPAKAVQVLDLMLEMFDSGNRWIKKRQSDRQGSYCMMGALRTIRRRRKIKDDGTGHYLSKVIRDYDAIYYFGPHDIVYFNDNHCTRFADVHEVILRARALAEAECPRLAKAA